jgi:hypothetical protein
MVRIAELRLFNGVFSGSYVEITGNNVTHSSVAASLTGIYSSKCVSYNITNIDKDLIAEDAGSDIITTRSSV